MIRNRKIRCAVSSMLLVIMFAAFGFVLPTSAVEAKASPKLSASSVTIAYGGQQTIKLKNGKGTWSIEGDDVIKVKKKTNTQITVAPVKSGTATVSCKVGKKTLQCKVRVLNNKIGKAETDLEHAAVVGESFGFDYTLPKGVSLAGTEYDKTIGKVTVKTNLDNTTGKTAVNLKINALKPGRFTLVINYMNGTEPEADVLNYAFINGFRGKTKAGKTSANYRKWRKKTISALASEDMSTWEIIGAIGTLISTGKYSSSGGVTGIQLWYGGNGTCISGAKMMDDFMSDLGIKCSVHFAGKDKSPTDIYGYRIYYASQHRNVRVTLGGKKYELNPQPEVPWPIGTVKR
ncbi:MAG: hypothetical protein IKF42_11560 [Mogibacterium sp.]|nr:hypothetical protein [Mogibacterium sp.]